MDRDELIRRGFTVARKPYLPGQWWARDPERQEFTIDFDRLTYIRWGVPPEERPLAELLGEHQARAEAVEAAQSVHGNVGFFVAECLAAGFELDAELNARCKHSVLRNGKEIDLGNRFVRFRGVTYLAFEWARSLVDFDWEPHELAELTGKSAPGRVEPAPPRFLPPSDEPPAEPQRLKERWLLV